MNTKILKLCGWGGIACIVLMAIGFAVVAGFIPPLAPSDSAEQTARLFIENKSAIRIGMILSMISSALLMPFAVAITLQMRRIEGPHSALAFYFPVAVFVIWMIVLSIYLVRAVDHQLRQESLADNPLALSAEVQRLRAELDRLAAKIATKNGGPIQ